MAKRLRNTGISDKETVQKTKLEHPQIGINKSFEINKNSTGFLKIQLTCFIVLKDKLLKSGNPVTATIFFKVYSNAFFLRVWQDMLSAKSIISKQFEG